MSLMEKIFVAVILAATAVIMYFYFSALSDCDQRGGVLVRGPVAYVCVKSQ